MDEALARRRRCGRLVTVLTTLVCCSKNVLGPLPVAATSAAIHRSRNERSQIHIRRNSGHGIFAREAASTTRRAAVSVGKRRIFCGEKRTYSFGSDECVVLRLRGGSVTSSEEQQHIDERVDGSSSDESSQVTAFERSKQLEARSDWILEQLNLRQQRLGLLSQSLREVCSIHDLLACLPACLPLRLLARLPPR